MKKTIPTFKTDEKAERFVDTADLSGQVGVRRRAGVRWHGPPVVRRGQANPEAGGDDQPHQVAAGRPGLAQRRHEVHGPNPAMDDAVMPGPAPG